MSRDIPLTAIDPDPDQPRTVFHEAEIHELAATLHTHGLIIPILVRPVGDRFVLVHGERRFRAAQSLGWETITAEVRDISPDESRWIALIENIQRKELSPIEEARAYQSFLDTGITQTDLAARIGKTQSFIAQKLRLVRLPDLVQAALAAGDITEGHARQLLKVSDAGTQERICARICADRLSVKSTTDLVDDALQLQAHEAIIQQGLHRLSSGLIAMGESIQRVQAVLTPDQFDAWCQAHALTPEIVRAIVEYQESDGFGFPDCLLDYMTASVR